MRSSVRTSLPKLIVVLCGSGNEELRFLAKNDIITILAHKQSHYIEAFIYVLHLRGCWIDVGVRLL